MFRTLGVSAFAVAALSLSLPTATLAQTASSGSGWFVPKGQAPAAASSGASRRRAAAPPPAILDQAEDQSGGQGIDPQGGPQGGAQAPQTPPVLPLPPIPALSELPRGTAPPAAAIGVLSVQDVMRQSTAAQQVEKVLGARRDKLNQDAQKEQLSWRDLQQQILKSTASPDQLQARKLALQQRVLQAQRDFRNRNRILQEAAQVALGQVERELVQVIRQVASARGMNLVLHREQVALNINDFDITLQVANQLNSTLNSVFIPGDGVDSEELAKSGTFPTTANPGPQQPVPVAAAAPAAATPVTATRVKK